MLKLSERESERKRARTEIDSSLRRRWTVRAASSTTITFSHRRSLFHFLPLFYIGPVSVRFEFFSSEAKRTWNSCSRAASFSSSLSDILMRCLMCTFPLSLFLFSLQSKTQLAHIIINASAITIATRHVCVVCTVYSRERSLSLSLSLTFPSLHVLLVVCKARCYVCLIAAQYCTPLTVYANT